MKVAWKKYFKELTIIGTSYLIWSNILHQELNKKQDEHLCIIYTMETFETFQGTNPHLYLKDSKTDYASHLSHWIVPSFVSNKCGLCVWLGATWPFNEEHVGLWVGISNLDH